MLSIIHFSVSNTIGRLNYYNICHNQIAYIFNNDYIVSSQGRQITTIKCVDTCYCFNYVEHFFFQTKIAQYNIGTFSNWLLFAFNHVQLSMITIAYILLYFNHCIAGHFNYFLVHAIIVFVKYFQGRRIQFVPCALSQFVWHDYYYYIILLYTDKNYNISNDCMNLNRCDMFNLLVRYKI